MRFSNKFQYIIVIIACFFIFIYGFISVNTLCTDKFNLGENKNNNGYLGETKSSIIKIEEDRAPIKISMNSDEKFKISLEKYDIVFSKKVLVDFKNKIVKKGENLLDFSKNND